MARPARCSATHSNPAVVSVAVVTTVPRLVVVSSSSSASPNNIAAMMANKRSPPVVGVMGGCYPRPVCVNQAVGEGGQTEVGAAATRRAVVSGGSYTDDGFVVGKPLIGRPRKGYRLAALACRWCESPNCGAALRYGYWFWHIPHCVGRDPDVRSQLDGRWVGLAHGRPGVDGRRRIRSGPVLRFLEPFACTASSRRPAATSGRGPHARLRRRDNSATGKSATGKSATGGRRVGNRPGQGDVIRHHPRQKLIVLRPWSCAWLC